MSKHNREKRGRKFTYRPPTILESVKGTWGEAVMRDTPPEYHNQRPIPPHVVSGTIPESDIDYSRLQPDGSPNILTDGGKPMTKESTLSKIRTVDTAMEKQGYTYTQRALYHQQVMAWMLDHTSLISQTNMILDAYHESGAIDTEKFMQEL